MDPLAATAAARVGRAVSNGRSDSGVIGQGLAAIARLYSVPPATVGGLLLAGALLGALGDAFLHAPDGPPGLNLSLWVASVAVAALALHRYAAVALERERIVWLAIGVLFAAGFAWRDAPALKLLGLLCAIASFALAAHRLDASWVRRSGIFGYAAALALGALHGWTAAVLALADATVGTRRVEGRNAARWRSVAAVVRGLAIATPLVVLFGALFASADAVFAGLVSNLVRVDFTWLGGHLLLFSILAWLATGYLRGFLSGTEPPPLRVLMWNGALLGIAPKRPRLGITEIATVLAALDLLFLVFVSVQFRYLFGGDALIQVTPDLTYADYARHGFFELVFAVVLVVPVLLAADWLLDRAIPRHAVVFGGLAGVQIALVLAITASAFYRLRLYHASFGLTEPRLYAMVLLLWIGAVLLWLCATVLRGRREPFAFGALASGLVTVGILFAAAPDAVIARANVARMRAADPAVRFDVRYAMSLSADAVPVLIEALPGLPIDARCPIARSLLRRWGPGQPRSWRTWNWSAARAGAAVREHEAALRSLVQENPRCEAPRAG